MTRTTAALLSLLAIGLSSNHQSNTYPKASLLIEACDLAKPEARSGYRILDTRSKGKYEAGHMPGAVRVDAAGWSKAFNADPAVNHWSKRVGELGIDLDTPVVVYGESDTPDAARIWWMLRYRGIRDVRLLNGGWQAWEKDVGQVAKKEPPVTPKHRQLDPQKGRLTTKEQLLESLRSNPVQIIDARSLAEHCGQQNTAQRNGAIPGAAHLEWKEVLDPKTHRFKSAEDLGKLFQEK